MGSIGLRGGGAVGRGAVGELGSLGSAGVGSGEGGRSPGSGGSLGGPQVLHSKASANEPSNGTSAAM